MTVADRLTAAVGSHRGTSAADRLCAACVEFLAVDAATISLVFDGVNAGTMGASDDRARAYDELQFTFGEGPCLESVASRAPVLVVDLAEITYADRWPGYAPAMLAHDIRSVFAVPVLVAGQYLGALDLFRQEPGALRPDDLGGAFVAAELAELPLLDLLRQDLRSAAADPDTLAWADLNALTRAEISQAVGMLVAQLEIDPAQALVRLRARAYAEGRSATQVARDILDHTLRLETD